MKVLVTGGAGFIGSHVTDCLIKNGLSVSVLDSLVRGSTSNINPHAKFYRADVLDDEVKTIFADMEFDYVIHLAGQISVTYSCAQPVDDATANVIGLLKVLDHCRRYGVKGVVFASSGGAVYAESRGRAVTEQSPKQPLSPYGVSKLASEYYLSQFSVLTGIPCITLRLANVYGPRQDPQGEAGVVSIFLERMLRADPTVIYGDGTQVRDFVYVQDVAEAMQLAVNYLADQSQSEDCLSPDIDAHALNIGTGIATSVNDLRNLCAGVAHYGGITQYGPPRPGEIRWSCLNSQRAEEKLGWHARTTLESGIRKTADWLTSELRRDS